MFDLDLAAAAFAWSRLVTLLCVVVICWTVVAAVVRVLEVYPC